MLSQRVLVAVNLEIVGRKGLPSIEIGLALEYI